MITVLIQWMSKEEPMIEKSVFSAEVVAIQHEIETLLGIQYKFRMMGVPIEGTSYIYGDNMLFIHNTMQQKINLS